MRLSVFERTAIKQSVRAVDPGARVFLFGSRADDSSRGGDIDLIVMSEVVGLPEKISILIAIKDKIGDQKIDIVLRKNLEDCNDSFGQEILKNAVEL